MTISSIRITKKYLRYREVEDFDDMILRDESNEDKIEKLKESGLKISYLEYKIKKKLRMEFKSQIDYVKSLPADQLSGSIDLKLEKDIDYYIKPQKHTTNKSNRFVATRGMHYEILYQGIFRLKGKKRKDIKEEINLLKFCIVEILHVNSRPKPTILSIKRSLHDFKDVEGEFDISMVMVLDNDVSRKLEFECEYWLPRNKLDNEDSKWGPIPHNKRHTIKSKKIAKGFDRSNFDYDKIRPGQRFLFFKNCPVDEVEPSQIKIFLKSIFNIFSKAKKSVEDYLENNKGKIWIGLAVGASADGDLQRIRHLPLPPTIREYIEDKAKKAMKYLEEEVKQRYIKECIENKKNVEKLKKEIEENNPNTVGGHVSVGFILNLEDLLNDKKEWVRAGCLFIYGLKLGEGGGASGGVSGMIFLGYDNVDQLEQYKPASFDFELALGVTLTKLIGKAIKPLKEIFKKIAALQKIPRSAPGKIKTITETIVKNYLGNIDSNKKYEITFPIAGVGVHLWRGLKDAEVKSLYLVVPKLWLEAEKGKKRE